MTSLHDLKKMVDEAIERAHGSPVADYPIRFNGFDQVTLGLTLGREKNQPELMLLSGRYINEAPDATD